MTCKYRRKTYIFTLYLILFWSFSAVSKSKIYCEGSNCDDEKPKTKIESSEKFSKKVDFEKPIEMNTTDLSSEKSQKTQIQLKKNIGLGNKTFKKQVAPVEPEEPTNMPSYYHNQKVNNDNFQNRAGWVLTNANPEFKPNFIDPGKKVLAQLNGDLIVTPNAPVPLSVSVVTGSMKGSTIFGEATLDRDLHRVLVRFKSITKNGEAFSVAAHGLGIKGTLGLEGEYHAEDNGLLMGGFLSTFLAGFTEASIERHRNSDGNYVDEPSLNNQVKHGLTTTLGKASSRMEERAMQMPGYTEIKGPILLEVIFE
jgi:hypothetical protein